MKKTLFEFGEGDVGESVQAEPTRVVVGEVASRNNAQVLATVATKVQSVCLTSVKGYAKCADCPELAMVQDTSSAMFPIKVFCKVEKCVRSA